MLNKIKSIRGIKDYLPEETDIWQYVEKKIIKILITYGYKEIRLPVIERTNLFKRSIGNITDVVEKEMYNFIDRNGNSLTLRPEGTTGCVRSIIENNLMFSKFKKFWYSGPMFRYERPQKGRYRQFHQIGVEVFGELNPEIEIELILMTNRLWHIFGINKHIYLELNSIGSVETRKKFKKELTKFLYKQKNKLDEECLRRIYINPIRILDTKNPKILEILNNAPNILDYLDNISRKHFFNLCYILNLFGIKYKINSHLVRGLDYYNQTVFEWVTEKLGSQGTICAGGRYNNLVKQLGGYNIPAVGFAIGLERLLLLLNVVNPKFIKIPKLDVYIISFGKNIKYLGIKLAEQLHNELPSLKLIVNHGECNFKKQFSIANKQGAHIAIVIGKREAFNKKVVIKDLYKGIQETILQKNIISKIKSILNIK